MDKKHKLCVVGAGTWGLNHVKTLKNLNALGGIIEKNNLVKSELKSTYPECFISSSIEKSFDIDFDGYIIATPPNTHYEIAKKIILKNIPVLVEKPITLNLNDAVKLNNLAKQKNVNLMVGHVLLFHPAFVKIKSLIDNGQLGDIQYIYSNRLNLGSFRSQENVLWSFAPHDIALFNYFFDDNPEHITSRGVDILQKNIHDTTITTFEYKKNKMGHIFVSWLHPFKEHRFVIVGSKGMVHFEDTGRKKPLIFYDKTVDVAEGFPKSKLGRNHEIEYDNERPLTAELKYFISRLDGRNIEIANGDSAINVMKLLERASESLSGN